MDRKSELAANLALVRERISRAISASKREISEVELIAVTKTFPASDIEILYELGLRNFGENRDQEGSFKAPQLPKDAIWHFQGQIQSNKLKSISNWANVIHSLDEIRHAAKLNQLLNTPKSIFIQVSLDGQESSNKLNGAAGLNRGGVQPGALSDFLAEIGKMENLNPIGLMAVAPLNQNPGPAFARLQEIQEIARKIDPRIINISAGMSNDFEEAIAHGATHIRIGSQILGVR